MIYFSFIWSLGGSGDTKTLVMRASALFLLLFMTFLVMSKRERGS